jgi:hypothetical protein
MYAMERAKNLITNLFKGNGHISKCEVCGNEYDKCFEVRMNDWALDQNKIKSL